MRDEDTWEALARKDPYWAVLTSERFRRGNLSDAAVRDFFESGVRNVEVVFDTVRRRLDADFTPRSVLDFGCGVGRVLLSLAERCDRVVGVDVSETMLAEAREHCRRRGLPNVHSICSAICSYPACPSIVGSFRRSWVIVHRSGLPVTVGSSMMRTFVFAGS